MRTLVPGIGKEGQGLLFTIIEKLGTVLRLGYRRKRYNALRACSLGSQMNAYLPPLP
jgi:hypothetical protein